MSAHTFVETTHAQKVLEYRTPVCARHECDAKTILNLIFLFEIEIYLQKTP
jgi:hypothetical protein